MDVGGGLGVDYDGTASTSHASVNYSLQEYANDVIYTIAEVCRDQELPMPHIISESGRALTAHHALLLLKVIDVESQAEPPLPEITEDDHSLLHDMIADFQTLAKKTRAAAQGARGLSTTRRSTRSARSSYFNSGVLSLRERAMAETIYFATINRIAQLARAAIATSSRRSSTELDAVLVDRYFCNFSLFQSLPDSWAIDQLFPIMPIHRLDEEPTRRGTLQDVTCDSDGKIDRFVGDKDGRPSLELHDFRDERGLHARHLPHGRVSGDPRRPAQPVRRHERGAHPHHRSRATRSPTSCMATR